jgi:hypothetical protein
MSLTGRSRVLADETTDAYGIAQWGWTNDELDAIRSSQGDPTANYAPMSNAEAWERRTDKDQIVGTYSECFTKTMGELISEEKILRDENGGVVDQRGHGPDGKGKCSPSNLGMRNPYFGDGVFRWRLKERNDYIMDHLLGLQDPAPSPGMEIPPR